MGIETLYSFLQVRLIDKRKQQLGSDEENKKYPVS
jgi:hypothetical protein